MSLPKRVLSIIKEHDLWQEGQHVCIAVSGGVDSMVLLHALHRTQRAHGGILSVCTIDHQFRPEAAEECARVIKEAEVLELPVYHKRLDIPSGGNLYERAREARQEALLSVGSDCIATGHHQADQAETILYRLLRGSGLQGLSGMRPKQGAWCRPLLHESKEAILSFATQEQLWWAEDPSNAKSLRGQLRALFPLLDDVHGNAISSMAQSAQLLAKDSDMLEAYTEQVWQDVMREEGICFSAWAALHEGMQLRILKKLCLVHNIPIRQRILSQFQRHPTKTQLPNGFGLCTEKGFIRLVFPPENHPK